MRLISNYVRCRGVGGGGVGGNGGGEVGGSGGGGGGAIVLNLGNFGGNTQ